MTGKRRQFLRAVAAVPLAGLAGCDALGTDSDGTANNTGSNQSGTTADDASETTALPRPSTERRWVADHDGNHVVLRGVNTVDPYWAGVNEESRGNSYEESLALATDRDAAWYPRVIRIPCQPASIESGGVESFAEEYLDPTIEH